MKVALVHDVLNQLGGAERVLDAFLEIWPDAVVHTVLYNEPQTEGRYAWFAKRTSVLSRVPLFRHHPKLALPFLPWAFRRFRFEGFDVVLSDSSSFAKFIHARGVPHVCYCHTPTRFLWTEPDYVETQPYPFIFRLAGKALLPILRRMDYRAAREADYLVANSRNVQARIKKFYGRESEVIPPPVDTEFFRPGGGKGGYYLAASRLEPYKRMDLAVAAFTRLGWPLKVAGTGTDLARLKAMAGPNVEFLGKVTDDHLRELYSGATAFVFPAEEDAGIMILEAQACGTPVIAYGAGGALETVVPGVTGGFFGKQETESLIDALKNFNSGKYNPDAVRAHAQQYDKSAFKKRIKEFVAGKIRPARPAGEAA